MMKQVENPTFTLSPIQQVIKAHRRGEPVGLYAVCCSHPSVLRAAMHVASEYDTVLLVEATSNQVDSSPPSSPPVPGVCGSPEGLAAPSDSEGGSERPARAAAVRILIASTSDCLKA